MTYPGLMLDEIYIGHLIIKPVYDAQVLHYVPGLFELFLSKAVVIGRQFKYEVQFSGY